MRGRLLPAVCVLLASSLAGLSAASALGGSERAGAEGSISRVAVVPTTGCPPGSTYSYQYRYCLPNDPRSPGAQVETIVKTAAIAYATAHRWKTSCSEGQFGFSCILYTPDPTGAGLTTPTNGQPVPAERATKALIDGVPTAVFDHLSYTALGGSGCAITLYFGSTYPYTMNGCGPSGLARLRKARADDARAFP